MAFDKEPCDKCKGYMEQGIILISIDEEKSAGDMDNPYRTGGWAVVKEEAILRIGLSPTLEQDILRRRMSYLTDETWDALGLPRGSQEEADAS